MARARRRRTAAKSQHVPAAAAGQRVWVLDLPYRMKHPQVRWYPNPGVHAYIGTQLPAELSGYAPPPYSYGRRLENTLNSTPRHETTAAPMTARPLQVEMAADMVRSLNAYGLVHLGADTGVGKTGATVLAVRSHLREAGVSDVLVIVDRPADCTIDSWGKTIGGLGDGGHRWLLISPDSLGKLIGPRGVPRVNFDVVVVDECQSFRHETQRTKHMRVVSKLLHAQHPALITITATLGHNPSEFLALAPHIAAVRGEPASRWRDLGARLIELGHPLERSRFDPRDYCWTREAREDVRLQQRSVEEVTGWLSNASPPAMVYRPAPWGSATIQAVGISLTAEQMRSYTSTWHRFRRENALARTNSNTQAGLAALIRLRQKASFIRCAQTAAVAIAQVRKGRQVVISAALVSTAADPIADAIEAAGLRCARIYGDHPVEAERLAFQTGSCPVAVLNKASAISLHAGEQLGDGQTATAAQRVGIFHAPVPGIVAKQTCGRIHRDYMSATWILLYGIGTIEERAAKAMVQNGQTATASTGGHIDMWADMAESFGVRWLTAASGASE